MIGILLLVLGATAFFATNKRDARQDRQREFEAAESARFPQGYRYIALDVKREDARWLRGVIHGPYKNVYFIRLPDGSIHTEGSHTMLTPIQIAYVPTQQWSVLTLQNKRLYRYRVHLNQTTYHALVTDWF